LKLRKVPPKEIIPLEDSYWPFLKNPFHNHRAVLKRKAELPEDLSFGSSAIFALKRPAAFLPPLTKGLALSGFDLYFEFSVLGRPLKGTFNWIEIRK
jgi:hypothetical protein